MSTKANIQFNARISEDTQRKMNELVRYYEETTPVGKITKSEVLKDIINKTHTLMLKQQQKS